MASKRPLSSSGWGDTARPAKHANVASHGSAYDGLAVHVRPSHLAHEDYTIAWICALSLELAASRRMLDSEHAVLGAKDNDHNSYVFGHIGRHNIVMAALPDVYGKVNAAAVSTNLKRSFPNIRATLMVGIGGGAPGEADLYLGDVVVGTRVMEYDLGKSTEDGQFEITAVPKHPSSLLLNAVTNLRSKHGKDQSSPHAQELLRSRLSQYTRPTQPDMLFQTSYQHPSDASTCESCDNSKLQTRKLRSTDDFLIHYGGIASGDNVCKSAQKRDDIARRLTVKCFEMESAGVMDSLRCLPIRGICDYSDSHKNKDWQDYAAATAASYARELLETISPLADADEPSKSISTTNKHIDSASAYYTKLGTEEGRRNLVELLDFPQINTRKEAIRPQQGKTCRWFLTHPKYAAWLHGAGPNPGLADHPLLYIRGKAGAGKSTLMKFLLSEANKQHKGAVISFFFNARGADLEKSIEGMYRSILKQIITLLPDVLAMIDEPELTKESGTACPSLNSLKSLLKTVVMNLGTRPLICFIDALDECNEDDVRDMVQYFEDLSEMAKDDNISFRVIFSSRPYPYIQVEEEALVTLENEAGHADDLAQYVQKCLKVPKKLQEELRREILDKASGVFMWIVLVVEILNKEASRGGLSLRRRLAETPPTLSKLFKEILTRDQERPQELRYCILWILCAARPLTSGQLCHAMWAAGLDSGQVDDAPPDAEDEDSNMALATSSSKGLVEIVRTKKKQQGTVQFIHESVRDFLIKERGLQEIWPDLGFEWEGPSHEMLRRCCESYLNHPAVQKVLKPHKVVSKDGGYYRSNDSSSSSDDDNVIGYTSEDSGASIVEQGFESDEDCVLLEYAVQHVLYHADKAAISIPQNDFLNRFFDHSRAMTFNRYQPSESRRYDWGMSTLYILADRGLARLVRAQQIDPELVPFGNDPSFDDALFVAMANGHKSTVAALLKLPSTTHEGKDLMEGLGRRSDMKRYRLRTAMTWAAQEGRIHLLEVLGRNRANISRKDGFGYTPLQRAAKNGQTAAVQALIRLGVSDDDDDYAEAIFQAIQNSDAEMSMMLLKQFNGWANMPERADAGFWLYHASMSGLHDVAKLLVEHGAELEPKLGGSAVVRAARDGNFQRCELLLSNGANVNHQDRNGQTALVVASKAGHVAIVDLLIGYGADLQARGSSGLTGYDYAIIKGHSMVAKLLKAAAQSKGVHDYTS